MTHMTEPTPNTHQRIAWIISELGHIEKDSQMKGGGSWGYNFRSIEAIKGHLKPLLGKHGVHYSANDSSLISDESLGGNKRRVVIRVEYVIHSAGGDELDVVRHVAWGEAIDSSDKVYAKAQTQAEKYMLLQVFAISDGSGEGEGDHHRPDYEPEWTIAESKKVVLAAVQNAAKKQDPEAVKAFVADWWKEVDGDSFPVTELAANDAAHRAINAARDHFSADAPAEAAQELLSEQTPSAGD